MCVCVCVCVCVRGDRGKGGKGDSVCVCVTHRSGDRKHCINYNLIRLLKHVCVGGDVSDFS